METLSNNFTAPVWTPYANGVPRFGGWHLSQTSVNLVGQLLVAYNEQIPLGEELHGTGHQVYTLGPLGPPKGPSNYILNDPLTFSTFIPHRYWYTEVVLNKGIHNLEGGYQVSMISDILKLGLVQLGRIMCNNGQNNVPCEVTVAIQHLEPPASWLDIQSYYYPNGKCVTEKYLYTTAYSKPIQYDTTPEHGQILFSGTFKGKVGI